ncbi:hypothetical protein BJ508DRAFT_334511 [Ascobolus immersus RN42]|uniref:Uncharacterized protein n=1 Tax=Ascobolus immersus RN42 TaxID=1160509 RepID=A0A3N4HFP6_ASCIM|nr:hypothetical protein BJ508DRAFT_334511 [Ascobolus immersus RN42]
MAPSVQEMFLQYHSKYGWLRTLRQVIKSQFDDITPLDCTTPETLMASIPTTLSLLPKQARLQNDRKYQSQVLTASRLLLHRNYGKPWIQDVKPYLHIMLPYGRAIARLRVSAHKLEVERRRYHNQVAREGRLCQDCALLDQVVVEDEEHVALDCPSWARWRDGMIKAAGLDQSTLSRKQFMAAMMDPKPGEALAVGAFWHRVFGKVDKRWT